MIVADLVSIDSDGIETFVGAFRFLGLPNSGDTLSYVATSSFVHHLTVRRTKHRAARVGDEDQPAATIYADLKEIEM